MKFNGGFEGFISFQSQITAVNVSSKEVRRENKWIHKTVSRSGGCGNFESTERREADSRIDETGALRLSRPVG